MATHYVGTNLKWCGVLMVLPLATRLILWLMCSFVMLHLFTAVSAVRGRTLGTISGLFMN